VAGKLEDRWQKVEDGRWKIGRKCDIIIFVILLTIAENIMGSDCGSCGGCCGGDEPKDGGESK